MKYSTRNRIRGLRMAMTVAALAICSTPALAAEVQSPASAPNRMVLSTKTQGLNLLGATQNGTSRPRIAASWGSGSYVCTPSGFGQRSRCFRR